MLMILMRMFVAIIGTIHIFFKLIKIFLEQICKLLKKPKLLN